MSILVTGGAGYIGTHTCINLLERGYEVYLIDSYLNSSPKSLKRVIKILEMEKIAVKRKLHIYKGDLRDKILLNKIFDDAKHKGDKIDSVIHFAGLKSVEESIKKPIEYWDANVNSTINLLNVMQERDCKTIVFSSSAAIYGDNTEEKVDENSLIKPVNPYGFTKKIIEEFLSNIYISDANNWKILNLRYFNPIGAHKSGLIGESPKGIPNNIFPFLTNVALGNYEELKIFGNDWPTFDGTGIRDYIHVMDLADGHVCGLEYLKENQPQYLNLNIGNGVGVSVLKLVNTFKKVNNVEIPYSFVKRRSGDVAKLVADNSLIKSLLNWSPKRNLEEMCRDGWNWHRKNPNGYDR